MVLCQCAHCGANFHPAFNSQVCCSEGCYRAAHDLDDALTRHYEPFRADFVCDGCGRVIGNCDCLEDR